MEIDCIYCSKDKNLKELMSEICKLEGSILYLFRDQKHLGRCVLAYKYHATELFEIPRYNYEIYMKELKFVANKLKELFNCDKVNYAVYGDLINHVHFHIVPKYKDGIQWGEPFSDKINPKFLKDEEFEKIKNLILKKVTN
ncbi:HIT family protein [Cetobacterium sp. 8H]|uniref:HIT family protein n=1 Tax=Cetobacterium sp. 8H TaxID=2759681 RepID=UPI00163CDC5E|nr:HIT family protein [Cetobacterium sp. 8H]MBC2849887.1 HIT family protein [Cetobacterium sp. 8H]